MCPTSDYTNVFSFWGLSNSHFTFVERDFSGTALTQHPSLRLLNYKRTTQNLLRKPHLREERTEAETEAQGHRGVLQHSWEEFPGLRYPDGSSERCILSSEGSGSVSIPACREGRGEWPGDTHPLIARSKSGPLYHLFSKQSLY